MPEKAGPAATDAYLENEATAYRKGDAGKLARIVNDRLDAAPEKPDRLLIYVDQWEELYAMAPTTEDAEQRKQHSSDIDKFIALLVAAASGQKSRATAVLTVRADFYNPLIRHALLSKLLPRQQVNIPPMSPGDLRAAIETPATKAGLFFTPSALVDQILNDVGTEEGRLPLLQFALKETWERREEDRLTSKAYTEVGGVQGAIQQTAERAYAALTPVQQEAARRLFLRLVAPGEGQEDTRARSAIPDDPQQRDVINLFSNPRTRLLVTGYETLQGPTPQAARDLRPTVEIAHEALIRRWPVLRAWVDTNRDKLRARAAILRAKTDWEEKDTSTCWTRVFSSSVGVPSSITLGTSQWTIFVTMWTARSREKNGVSTPSATLPSRTRNESPMPNVKQGKLPRTRGRRQTSPGANYGTAWLQPLPPRLLR